MPKRKKIKKRVSPYVRLDDLALDCQYILHTTGANVGTLERYLGLKTRAVCNIMQGRKPTCGTHGPALIKSRLIVENIVTLTPEECREFGKSFNRRFAESTPHDLASNG